jgi:hypothetical protein
MLLPKSKTSLKDRQKQQKEKLKKTCTITTARTTMITEPPPSQDAAPTATDKAVKGSAGETNTTSISEENDRLLESTLARLARGLPKRELKLMVSEADECEALLLKDIEELEKALEGNTEGTADLDVILEHPLTPLDRYWTASALLGRLRGDLTVPSIHTVPGGPNLLPPPKPTNVGDPSALVALLKNPIYTKKHATTVDLLATWKKISSHRTALVFKKPVKAEDAPGYTDRIVFPMDLSLIRKMIIARKVESYSDMHQYVGLISHNCVKYNGRETDYGMVAREFEAMADDVFLKANAAVVAAVENAPIVAPTVAPVATTSAAAAPVATATANSRPEPAKS